MEDHVARASSSPYGVVLDQTLVRALTPEKIRSTADELLALLPERTRRIVAARFGCFGKRPQTLQEIGRAEGITRERVRQLERAAFAFLRDGPASVSDVARAVRGSLHAALEALGRVARGEVLLSALGLNAEKDGATVRFLLAALPGVAEARETQRTAAHWTLADHAAGSAAAEPRGSLPALEHVLEVAEELLAREKRALADETFLHGVQRSLDRPLDTVALRSFLATSKRIAQTPFGEWGLKEWPDVSPRGVGDKAYVILKRAGQPLHFLALTNAINAAGFSGRSAHVQTVHNELIRGNRFVLVGRGVYGLREWGFEPGTVADVAARVLARAGQPLPKRELVAAVLKERFVKRNTVLLALQNRRLFRSLNDGTYVLAAATATSEGKPESASAAHSAERVAADAAGAPPGTSPAS